MYIYWIIALIIVVVVYKKLIKQTVFLASNKTDDFFRVRLNGDPARNALFLYRKFRPVHFQVLSKILE